MSADSDRSAASDGPDTDDADPERGPGGRDVVVPLRVYKTVIVFSTLIAVVSVVLGFMFLDAATLQVSVVRGVVVGGLSLLGVVPPDAVLNATLAVVGLLIIGFGAAVYTLGTRFRARGMGKSQEDSDEPSDNG